MRWLDVHGRATERISNAVDRSDELRVLRAVADRAPNFADEDVQIRIHHIRVRPDSCVQVGLFHHLRPALNQAAQQVERLRRQVDFASGAQQLACLGIDGELGESSSQCSSPDGPAESLDFP